MVIPVKNGVQALRITIWKDWIPAYAGMTENGVFDFLTNRQYLLMMIFNKTNSIKGFFIINIIMNPQDEVRYASYKGFFLDTLL